MQGEDKMKKVLLLFLIEFHLQTNTSPKQNHISALLYEPDMQLNCNMGDDYNFMGE